MTIYRGGAAGGIITGFPLMNYISRVIFRACIFMCKYCPDASKYLFDLPGREADGMFEMYYSSAS